MTICSVLIAVFARDIGNVYTDGDKDIADLVVVLAPLASTFQVFDALLGICNGAFEGAWRQKILAITNMISLWAIGVTLGTSLAFATSLRTKGIWIGLMSGVIFSGTTLAVMVSRVKWQDEAELAKESAVNVHNTDEQEDGAVAAV